MHFVIRQYIKLTVFIGCAGIELVVKEQGKGEVSELDMATKSTCSN